MSYTAEDEFTLGLFLTGEDVYSYKDKKAKLICINCNKVFPFDEEIDKCPNCYMNAIIYYNKKSSLDKFQIWMLREKIIFNVFELFDFQELEED